MGYHATIGVDFLQTKYKTVNNDEISVRFWDTAGHERFRTLTYTYYKQANAVIVVFDLSDSKTFDNVRMWLWCLR